MKSTVKNNIFLFFFFLLFVENVTAQVSTYPHTEGFESGLNGWSPEPDGGSVQWKCGTGNSAQHTIQENGTLKILTGPSAAHSGNRFAFVDTYNDRPSKSVEMIKHFNFKDLKNPILSFYLNACFNNGDGAVFHVYAKANGDYYYVDLWRNFENLGEDWVKINVCLDDYAGVEDVILKFSVDKTSDIYSNVAIDDIKIEDFTVDAEVTDVTCYGYEDGEVLVTPHGAGPYYTYSVNNGASFTDPGHNTTSYSFKNLVAKGYPVMIRDVASGCVARNSLVTVVQPAEIELDIEKKDILCYGAKSGEIKIKASESTGNNTPYYYSIDGSYPNEVSDIFKNLTGGNYSVRVRNNKGCLTEPQEVKIGENVLLSIEEVKINNIQKCYGDLTGSVVVSVIFGDNGPIDYSLDGGVTYNNGLNQFSRLAAGTYNLVVKDRNNCTITYGEDVVVTQPDKLIYEETVVTNVEGCSGDRTGALEMKVSGGTQPYYYSLTRGVSFLNSPIFSDLKAGNYVPYVSDGKGCLVVGDEVIISEPEPLAFKSIKSKDVETCFGDETGSIEIVSSGGTGDIQYSLTGDDSNLQSSGSFPTLGAGIYYPFIIDSKGCTKTTSEITISQPTKFEVLTVTPISDANLCYGDAKGQVFAFASGGTSPYYFSVDNFANSVSIDDYTSAAIIGKLAAGDYKLYSKDQNGCSGVTTDFKITQPEELHLTDVEISDVDCYGNKTGSAILTGEGGVTPYSYGYSKSGENYYRYFTNPQIIDMYAGAYDFSIKDNNGCLAFSKGYTIEQPNEFEVTQIRATPVSTCYGDANGGIDIVVKGGTKPYKYSIDGGETFVDDWSFNNLKGAVDGYSVVAKDANGCTFLPVSISISQPTPLEIFGLYYNEVQGCKGSDNGSIVFSGKGGTGKLLYSLDGVNFNNESGEFKNLPAGVYKPSVQDANGCITTRDVDITITEPDKMEITSITTTPVTCNGQSNGEVVIEVTGGRQFQVDFPYKFFFNGYDDPLTYDGFLDGLKAGEYDFFVEDYYKCTLEGSFTIEQPEKLEISSVDIVNIEKCHGDLTGSLKINCKGGVEPLTYSISGLSASESNETGEFTGLGAHSFEVAVRDANNCKVFAYPELSEPEAVSYSAKLVKSIRCHDSELAEIDVTANGGTGNFKYSIDNGENYDYTDPKITGLDRGTYKVKAMDENGCTQKYCITISVTNPEELTIEAEAYDVVCFTGNTGKIISAGHGGTRPYFFSLDGGKSWQQNTGLFRELSDGVYKVILKDDNDCLVESEELTINRPDNIAKFSVSVDEGCSPLKIVITQEHEGIANYKISNGDLIYDRTEPTEYTLVNPLTTTQKFKIESSLMLTTGAGCSDTSSAYVTVFPKPKANLVMQTNSIVWPDNIANFINLTPNITTAHWDFGDGTTSDELHVNNHEYETCGSYNIILQVSDGVCSDEVTENFVIEGRPLYAVIKTDTASGCQPVSVKFKNESANSDSCMWDYGDGSQPVYNVWSTDHKYEAAGDYTVSLTIYGDCGVQATTTKVIHVYPKPTAGFIQNLDTLYAGQVLKVESQNSLSDHCIWNFGDGKTETGRTAEHKFEYDGVYTLSLIVNTSNSCSDTSEVKNAVVVVSTPIVVFPTAFSPNGDGLNDVFKPIHGDVAEFKIVILNRLGVIVYRGNNINEGWDGTRNGRPCPPGLYVWKSTTTLRDKSFFQQQGHVILLK